MKKATGFWFSLFALLLHLACGANAADYRLESAEAKPPEGIAKEVADSLQSTSVKVFAGKSRLVCEIWLTKSWPVQAGFKRTDQVLYPFTSGSLIGVARYATTGADFREQEIAKGLYTVRYGQQPVDGNHVGTSPTRDFLTLLPAAKDKSTKPLDEKQLFALSAEAAGAKHPAILCLRQSPSADAKSAKPTLVHEESHDWWCVQAPGQGTAGKDSSPLILDFVVIGKAAE